MSASTFPTIHMNGTSGRDLAEGYADAYRAVDAAIDAVAKAGPNGRDYYPQGAEAMSRATIEHRERLEALRKVYEELQELCIHCVDNDTRKEG